MSQTKIHLLRTIYQHGPQTAEELEDKGFDAINRPLKQLEVAGYLERDYDQHRGGRVWKIAGWFDDLFALREEHRG